MTVRKRIRKGPTVTVVHLQEAARMVTLRHPDCDVQEGRGAFVRLDPPANLSPEDVASWRERAAAVALAVRVLPGRQDEAVPAEDARPAADRGADVRAEAVEIGRERGGEELAAEVERIFG